MFSVVGCLSFKSVFFFFFFNSILKGVSDFSHNLRSGLVVFVFGFSFISLTFCLFLLLL